MAYLRFVTDKKLVEELKKSKTELYWLAYQIETSTGQPHAVYTSQWYKEQKNHDQIEAELEKRGLVQN